jgi:hypothetical protein
MNGVPSSGPYLQRKLQVDGTEYDSEPLFFHELQVLTECGKMFNI